MSYLQTRKPTEAELRDCERIELTSADSWEPHLLTLEDSSEGETSIGRAVHSIAQGTRNPIELDGDPVGRSVQVLKSCLHKTCTLENDPVSHEADVIAPSTSCRDQSGVGSNQRQSVITKEVLVQGWFIGQDPANRTLQASTQEGMHFVEGPIERRLRTSQAHMRFPSLIVTICSDTLFSNVHSVRGYTCAQVFIDGHGFVRVYPLSSKGGAHHALMRFIHQVGVPKYLLTGRAQEEMRGEWGQIVKKYRVRKRTTESHSPWQNRAEAKIRELKKLTRRALRSNNTPSEFWCYAIEWAARIRSYTAHDSINLGSRTPEEHITGTTPDISEYIHFTWSQWIWYKEPTPFPGTDVHLGKWMGVAQDVGQAMTYWVLTSKRTIIARSSIAPLSNIDLRDPTLKDRFNEFNKSCFASSHSKGDI